jgi:purine-nucleoside phosphorylase
MRVAHRTAGSSTIAADSIREQLGQSFNTMVVTGSGFSFKPQSAMVDESIPYAAVPGMPIGSVAGHAHEFRRIRSGAVNHLLCAGRFHLYEGHSPEDCTILVDIAHELQCQRVILMNAVGALHSRYLVGDVVFPSECIDLTFMPQRLVSPALARHPQSDDWRGRALDECRLAGLSVLSGTYVQVLGPSYETRSEVAMLRRLGGDIVGMSTATEAKRARNHGIDYLVVSLVTNVHSTATANIVSHTDVIEAAHASANKLSKIIELCLA